jgi:hypothetical protein
MPDRIFIVHLQPLDDRDGIRAMRWALKFLLRRFGLKAISIQEINHADTDESDRVVPVGTLHGDGLGHQH